MKQNTRFSCGQRPAHGHVFGKPDTAHSPWPRAITNSPTIHKMQCEGWEDRFTGLPFGRSGDKLVRKAMTRRVGIATIR